MKFRNVLRSQAGQVFWSVYWWFFSESVEVSCWQKSYLSLIYPVMGIRSFPYVSAHAAAKKWHRTLFPLIFPSILVRVNSCVCVSFYSIWNGRKSEIEQLKTTTAIAQQLAASLYHAIRYRYCCCCSPFNQVRPIMWEWKRVSDIFFRSLPDIPYSFYLFRA